MTHHDTREAKLEHFVWAIQHHAQLHKGSTKEVWLWPSKRMVDHDLIKQSPVDSRIDQLEKAPQILSCIRSLMTGNKSDLLLEQNTSGMMSKEQSAMINKIEYVPNVPEHETQMMLQITMDVINQAVAQVAEFSKAGKRIGSAGRVVRAYEECLGEIFLSHKHAGQVSQPTVSPELI